MVRRIKATAVWSGLILLVIIGWCGMMVAYFAVYEAFEANAVPVSFGSTKEFSALAWDAGYFHAKGTYKNNSAYEDGDELIPQVDDISCYRQTNSCTIAIADVYDHFLGLGVNNYDIATWTDKQITFMDDSGECATSSFTIDRPTQSVNLMVRKKANISAEDRKSPLFACDKLQDKDVTLSDGFPVYWHLRQRFEQRNGLYFHILLIVINVAYFAALYLWWRKRRRRLRNLLGRSLPSSLSVTHA